MTALQLPKEIYLAGGCFWGVEKYFSLVEGVVETQVGYANGPTPDPSYEDVCADSGHVEAVKVVYDPSRVNLAFLLEMLFEVIDPVAVNRQGDDVGVQYRTGIYYTDPGDALVAELALTGLQRSYGEPLAVESRPLENFFPAEDHHQRYLDKNPTGVCHIAPAALARAASVAPQSRFLKEVDALRDRLTPLQYEVTMHGGTEAPYTGEYHDTIEPGIYVDVTTGRPLFVSTAKFDAGCGWPSFTRPIEPDAVVEVEDTSRNRIRTEVRSALGDVHLGHVFEDGPAELGGRRFCINSAALRFVPREELEAQGYGDLVQLVDDEAAESRR